MESAKDAGSGPCGSRHGSSLRASGGVGSSIGSTDCVRERGRKTGESERCGIGSGGSYPGRRLVASVLLGAIHVEIVSVGIIDHGRWEILDLQATDGLGTQLLVGYQIRLLYRLGGQRGGTSH